jgi:DNA-binding transcriptional LysR family regulator
MPLYLCAAELQAGTLKVLLPEWRPKPGQLVVLFPSRRGLAPAVCVFVEFLKTELGRIFETEKQGSRESMTK